MSEDLAPLPPLPPLPPLAYLRRVECSAMDTLVAVVLTEHASDEDRVYAAATLLEHVRDRYAAWSSE